MPLEVIVVVVLEGGGIGMGNTCKPMAVSFQCMTKSTTIKIIIIIKKKKKIDP